MTAHHPVTSPHMDVGLSILVYIRDPQDRRIAYTMLRRWRYDIHMVENPKQLDRLLGSAYYDIVLIDDPKCCTDLLPKTRAFQDITRRPQLILISPQDWHVVSNVNLDQGVDDFLISPINAYALRARVMAGVRARKTQVELVRKKSILSHMSEENDRLARLLKQDLDVARGIQTALTPRKGRRFGEYDIEFFVKSCSEVGGDFVTCFSNHLGQIGVCAIDVSGHGYSSALLGAIAVGYFNADDLSLNIAVEQRLAPYFFAVLRPNEVTHRLNKRLAIHDHSDVYMTMCYGVLDAGQNRFTFCQAGHPAPILTTSTGDVRSIGQGGMPVGLFAQAQYHDQELYVESGDRILIYSDGWTECLDDQGNELGTGRFEQIVSELRDQPSDGYLDMLHQRINAFSDNGLGIHDDLSAILITRRNAVAPNGS